MKRLMPILDRGGAVVASIFIENDYSLVEPSDCYGQQGCYRMVNYTLEQLAGMDSSLGLKSEDRDLCLTMDCVHHIFLFEKDRRA